LNKYLIAALVGLLLLALWRIDHVTGDRDAQATARATSEAATESLRDTLRLSRALLTDRDKADAEFTKGLKDAKDNNDQLRADLAADTKRVRVNAICVRDAADISTASGADAGTPRLTPDAAEARADLEYEVEAQRLQIVGLQGYITRLLATLNGGAIDE